MWLDIPRQAYQALAAPVRCDLLVVGGGYAGLWTALHAAQRNPGARVTLIEAERIGWAASGRNGGFVEASITHGAENGKSRWPNEFAELEELGLENLDGMQADIERLGLDVDWQRSGMLSVATEAHQVSWLRDAADAGEGRFLNRDEVRAEVASPTYLAALFSPDTCAIVHPAKLAVELARACQQAGVTIYEQTGATELSTDAGGLLVTTTGGIISADRVVLATNVFSSLIRRNRLYAVPVYDYVLSTEPLTDEQLRRIGWRGRQGIGDSANQFHYYRLSADNRIVWGGYDAIYHFGRKVDPASTPTADLRAAGGALLPDLPATRGCRVQPPLGRCDRHQHTILRALGHRPPRPRRLRQRVHRPGSRCGTVRCRCVPGPARLRRPVGPGWRWCVTNRCLFHRNRWPASEFRLPGGHSTRRTHRGEAQYTPENPGPAGTWIRLLIRVSPTLRGKAKHQ